MPLTRTTGLQRTGRLRRVSKKQSKFTSEKRKVYDAADKSRCFSCGEECRAHELTPSHILTQGRYKRQAANSLNIVWECWPTHQIWENNKTQYARQYPDAFAQKMERLQELDPQAYAFFRMKNPGLF